MEYRVKTGVLTELRTACLVIGVFEQNRLSAPAELVDEASGGRLLEILRRGDLSGDLGDSLLLYDLPGLASDRVLVVGCGKRKEFDRTKYRQVVTAAAQALNRQRSTDALSTLSELIPPGMGRYRTVRDAVTATAAAVYRYDRTKEDKKAPKHPLKRLDIWVGPDGDPEEARLAVRHGEAIARGTAWARELGNLPGNLCTPTYLAEQARWLEADAQTERLRVEVLEEADMEALGMGALLSVSRGSRQPAKLILMHYRGGGDDQSPVVFVGKGLTFDTGGISLKPAADMDEMKFDMCGAAGVFGAVRAAVDLGLPLNLIGVVPASENLPDGAANKPGDVVTSLSGQTIEILNTDAEGRLILCDALTYCERFNPDLVIDLATLTGACVVALGKHPAGLFTSDDRLADEILRAGEASGDRAWRLPLWDDYQTQIDSNFADMANVGGRDGGAITAACFLSRYTKKYRWAHLDIAGIAWLSGKEKGATGRPVALLAEILLRRSGVLPRPE
ncbi:leucyl aminopeptidase [Thioalkalicoccus limnaeus]|uniref:Probable cytosol aminopeptidase n=1 Tax=Thioalkalicoccus limnaeus TaxID=120681 RepID=A0ABV4BFE5_9GAMM